MDNLVRVTILFVAALSHVHADNTTTVTSLTSTTTTNTNTTTTNTKTTLTIVTATSTTITNTVVTIPPETSVTSTTITSTTSTSRGENQTSTTTSSSSSTSSWTPDIRTMAEPHCEPAWDTSCSNIGRTTVPIFNGTVDVYNIVLSDNYIAKVHTELSNISATLHYLDLRRNLISNITSEAFNGMSFLYDLDLSRNELSFLPTDLFKDTTRLMHLKLDDNQFENLANAKELFSSFESTLDTFSMARNFLTEITQSNFPKNLSSLVWLTLDGNIISSIEDNFFQDMEKLKRLYLGANSLENIGEIGVVKSHILKIDLSKNEFFTISDGQFDGYDNLEDVELQNMGLTSLPKDIFTPLTSLTFLHLQFNKLTQLDEDMFLTNTRLVGLRLDRNNIREIPEGLFKAATQLTQLSLCGNDILSMYPKTFNDLPDLQLISFDFDFQLRLCPNVLNCDVENGRLVTDKCSCRTTSTFPYVSQLKNDADSGQMVCERATTTNTPAPGGVTTPKDPESDGGGIPMSLLIVLGVICVCLVIAIIFIVALVRKQARKEKEMSRLIKDAPGMLMNPAFSRTHPMALSEEETGSGNNVIGDSAAAPPGEGLYYSSIEDHGTAAGGGGKLPVKVQPMQDLGYQTPLKPGAVKYNTSTLRKEDIAAYEMTLQAEDAGSVKYADPTAVSDGALYASAQSANVPYDTLTKPSSDSMPDTNAMKAAAKAGKGKVKVDDKNAYATFLDPQQQGAAGSSNSTGQYAVFADPNRPSSSVNSFGTTTPVMSNQYDLGMVEGGEGEYDLGSAGSHGNAYDLGAAGSAHPGDV